MSDEHVEAGHYAWTASNTADFSLLLRLVVEHLRAVCPRCDAAWDAVQSESPELDRRLAEARPPHGAAGDPLDDPLHPDLPEHLYPAFSAAAERFESTVGRLAYQHRRSRRQLTELLALPAGQRAATVRNARRRFRSRGLAELLLEESRQRVRTEPAEAARLAALVTEVLHRIPHAGDAPWRYALFARAAAHRANALRVAGDLPAADRRFAELRRHLDERPLADPAAAAEIAALEASLRIGQRHFRHADTLLDRAAELQREAGDGTDCARTLVLRGNLQLTLGRPAEALELHRQAATFFRPGDQTYLFLCTVTGRVNALCDLERFPEARHLLQRHLDLFEELDDLHLGATLRLLEGRVRLGLDELEAAESAITSAREAFTTLGRTYDADLTALYLAEVYLARERPEELKRLAAALVPAFRSRAVDREALACLRLFARSAVTRRVNHDLLADLRRHVSRAAMARGSADLV